MKKYLKDVKANIISEFTLWSDNKFMNQVATKYLVNLLMAVFIYKSKPVEFVEKLVRYFSDENSIISLGDQVRLKR